MSSGVTLTSATRQNLLSLQGTADLVATTQNRLSTGKKVNSALDDPTSFFTSQALSGRSGDLGALLNGIGNGVQTIQAANQGITSIQKLVDSAKSTANQALADKSAVSSGLASTAANVSGSKSFQGLAGTADGTQDFSSLAKEGSIDISLDGGKTNSTITINSATLGNNTSDLTKVSASQVVTAINNQISNTAALKGKVSASVGSDGRINFATASQGATQQLSVRGSANATLDIGFGTATSTTAAKVAGTSFTTAAPTFSATAGSYLTVGDGTTNTSLSVNSTSLKSNGTAVGTAPVIADVIDVFNQQLKAAGSTVTAVANGAIIEFRSQDIGPTSLPPTVAVATPTGLNTNVDIGFGTTVGAAGTASAGTGTAAIGLSSTGSDATDGSAKAAITGSKVIAAATGGPPATGGGLDFRTVAQGATTAQDASFSIKLGDGQSKKITLDSSTILSASTNKQYTSAQDVADTINAAISADTGLAGKVQATVDSNNKLVVNTTAAGSNQKLTITAAQGTVAAANLDVGFGSQTSTINGVATNTATALTSTGKDSTGSSNSTRQSLSKQFNELLNQITQQAKDSSYNGINLLYRSSNDENENTLKVTFNETGTSSISIKGTKVDADGLGLNSVTGGFQTDDEINKTLTAITAATSQLRAQSSTFGSNLSVVQNRQDFSKNLINILDTGSANLTNADLNEEAANSQALSTRQSLGISALSLANQANQGILQLLR
ncbi:flagellin [uncultured Methylobacterium sp.]|uniref:flagellin N-terminal helical domain-containing protein n=1 Tax=uncultured Methylobacterium sp. TaxID=157278 RepID=UPI0035CC4A34